MKQDKRKDAHKAYRHKQRENCLNQSTYKLEIAYNNNKVKTF